MKNLIFLFVFALLFIGQSCKTSKTKSSTTTTTTSSETQTEPDFVIWDKKFVELGAVKKGEKRSLEYSFTNNSKEIAKIDIVDACTCTTVDFPRGDIAPGETKKIDVVFDSEEKDESETIEIRIIFANQNKYGIPRIETVEYHFDLVKW